MSFYLVLVGPLDNPLSEHTFPSSRPQSLPSQANSSSLASSPASTPSSSSATFPSWSSTPQPSASPQYASSFGANAASMAGVKLGDGIDRRKGGPGGGYDVGHLRQMVAHSSLDLIEDGMISGNMYLKSIDKFNEWTVSAFVAPCVKFILLHEVKNDEGIRLFFLDVWEAYVKILLNPFHTPNTPIKGPLFDGKVRASARKYL